VLFRSIDDHPEIFEESVMIFLEALANTDVDNQEINFPDESPDDLELAYAFTDELIKHDFSKEAAAIILTYFSENFGDEDTLPEFIHWHKQLSGVHDESGVQKELHEYDFLFSIYILGIEKYVPNPTLEMPF
jgi:hypothetical protein